MADQKNSITPITSAKSPKTPLTIPAKPAEVIDTAISAKTAKLVRRKPAHTDFMSAFRNYNGDNKP